MLAGLSKSLQTELYRKAVHLSSLWMPLLILKTEQNTGITLFLFLFLGELAAEYAAYKKTPLAGSLFRRMFFKTLRPKEIISAKFVPSGATYVLAAALICSVCFTKTAAAAALAVMLVSDTCAALTGKFFGSFRFANGKSAEGTSAFFISALAVLAAVAPACPLPALVIAAGLATTVEFFEANLKIDDNFSIPLTTGFVLNLFYL